MPRWTTSALAATCLAAFVFALINAATREVGGEPDSAQSGSAAETAVAGQGAIGIQDVPFGGDDFALFNECRPIWTKVTVSSSTGIPEARLQDAVESRMRAAQLYLKEYRTLAVEDPFLAIAVTSDFDLDLDRYTAGIRIRGVNVEVQFLKGLYDPLSGTKRGAVTWSCDFSTRGRFYRTEHVVSTVAECLDRFVAEYLRANESACNARRASEPLSR